MSIPGPEPGLVIRYSFLWSHEAKVGAVEGSKDRPCAIVVAVSDDKNAKGRVVVAPITHTKPENADASIEIPAKTCKSLGLDAGRHWLRADELNRFTWPGFDLRPLPGKAGTYAYGLLPEYLYEKLRSAIIELWSKERIKPIADRD